MRRRLHWFYALGVAVLGLLAVSFYHQLQRPETQGHMLARALRQDGFAARLRPALPIIDHVAATPRSEDADLSAAAPSRPALPGGCTFFRQRSSPRHPQMYALLDNAPPAQSIIKALAHAGHYPDYAAELVQDARTALQKLPPEKLLNQLIAADAAVLESNDDLPASITSALLLTALRPEGAAGCIITPTQRVYLLALAADNPPGSPDYVLTLYAFDPTGQELWTGSLEVPRTWTPDQTFALLDGLIRNRAPGESTAP